MSIPDAEQVDLLEPWRPQDHDSSAAEQPKRRTRERATVVFPYDDLKNAKAVADMVHRTYGGRCTQEQVAAAMGHTPKSGAFKMKLAAARIFGLVTVKGQDVTLTDLGVHICDPDRFRQAVVEAFLNAPLYHKLYERYRAGILPDDAGLERAAREMGVSEKQAAHARRVFTRSADFAGFFEHGKNRLVLPAATSVSRDTDEQGDEDDGEKDEGTYDMPSVMRHPLIVGLLGVLPEPGEELPDEQRELWLKTLEMNLQMIYPRRDKDRTHVQTQEARNGVAAFTGTSTNPT